MIYILILSQLFLIGIALFIGLQFMQMKRFTLHMSQDVKIQKEKIEVLENQLDEKNEEVNKLTRDIILKEETTHTLQRDLSAKEIETESLQNLLSVQENTSPEDWEEVMPMKDIVLPLEGIIIENASNEQLCEKLKDIQRKTIHLVSFTRKEENNTPTNLMVPDIQSVQRTPQKEETSDTPLIQKAIRTIQLHLSDSSFNVDELSSLLGVSRVSLYKKILAETGDTPTKLIRNLRLEHSIQLLKEQYTVSEVAQKAGFNTPKYFTRYFKEKYGVSPQEYLKQSL